MLTRGARLPLRRQLISGRRLPWLLTRCPGRLLARCPGWLLTWLQARLARWPRWLLTVLPARLLTVLPARRVTGLTMLLTRWPARREAGTIATMRHRMLGDLRPGLSRLDAWHLRLVRGRLTARSLTVEREDLRDVRFRPGAARALRRLPAGIGGMLRSIPPMLRAVLLAAALHVVLLRAGTRRRRVTFLSRRRHTPA
ncbi:MAG TPA: hypothetical protein VLL08_00390 [Kineosporiaceae bacterium]|nr:hypothetical protein [Kineosporiaceae bacterium]